MMEVCSYRVNGFIHGHYLKHMGGSSRFGRRENSKGKYLCPKCGKVFKACDYRPHVRIVILGLVEG